MKMKEFGPRGARVPNAPLDQHFVICDCFNFPWSLFIGAQLAFSGSDVLENFRVSSAQVQIKHP